MSTEIPTLLPYTEDIESRIIEKINEATHSVFIVMAWFTSKRIKEALIATKRKKNDIAIEIIVDKNQVNEFYFYDSKQEFENAGIIMYEKWNRKFLHSKFIIIDSKITIIGSYNLTNRAKSNSENIVIVTDSRFSDFHHRVFKRITDENYVDENIKLLFEFPDFAQKLLATYYPYTRAEFKAYEAKIPLGCCYTFSTGDWDDIAYESGFIFNPKCSLDKRLKYHEFPLPLNKAAIKNWVGSRNDLMILDSYRGYESLYHEISGELNKNWETIQTQFKRSIEATYTYQELKQLIHGDLDLILEDTLWTCNFKMFLNKKVVGDIYEDLPVVEKVYWGIDFTDFNVI